MESATYNTETQHFLSPLEADWNCRKRICIYFEGPQSVAQGFALYKCAGGSGSVRS